MIELLTWIVGDGEALSMVGRLALFCVVSFAIVVFVCGATRNIIEGIAREVANLSRDDDKSDKLPWDK